MSQPSVFLSYSHKDEAEKNELLDHLGVLRQAGLLEVWSDDQIRGGEDWKQKIEEAMSQARVAILLISANFLTSDFINEKEVPTLLKRRREEGLIILPVIARACAWQQVGWLVDINVRPRDGRPIWGDSSKQADDDLAFIANEVATLVDLDPTEAGFAMSQEQSQVDSPINDQNSGGPNVTFSVKLSDPDKKKIIKDILQRMFPDHKRIIVAKEFGEGFSGSWVFMVQLVRDRSPVLPVVVKIASPSLVDKEWRAYSIHIRDRWPYIAEIRQPPVQSGDGTLKGLYYSVVGEGIFEVLSLREYCLQAEIDDIRVVLVERLTKIIELGLKYSDKGFQHRLRASYDPVLPVNLLINPMALSDGAKPIVVTPETPPIPELKPDAYVRLENFVVTKVDLKDKTITLNLPRPETQLPDDAYVVRLKYTSETEMPAYPIGSPLPTPVEGQVIQTRASQWQLELKNFIAGQEFDMGGQTVRLPDGTELPNPFAAVPDILSRLRDIKVYHIHGDLNLENILVDPQARDVRLIDFAEARWDHVLLDFLRLETEVIIKLLPPALIEANLSVAIIRPFYEELHQATFSSPVVDTAGAPHPALEKAFAILKLLRMVVREYGLFERKDFTEYYDGLTLYLLGALKFGNLDKGPAAPLPKQLAFWGAAVIQGLFDINNYKEVENGRTALDDEYNEERFLDAAIPVRVSVGQVTELLVMVRLPDSDGLRGILKGEIYVQAQPEDVQSKRLEVEFPVDTAGNVISPELWIEVITTDFEVTEQRKKIKLDPSKDSDYMTFLLTPKKRGDLRIVIQVKLAETDLLLGEGFMRVNGYTNLDKSIQYAKTLVTMSLGVFGSKKIVASADSIPVAQVDLAEPIEGLRSSKVANPFMPGGRVSDLMKQLKLNPIVDHCYNLLTGRALHNLALEGEHGFGKTTLIKLIRQTAHQEKWGEPELELIFIELDCQTIDPFKPDYFWRRVLEKLRSEVRDNIILKEKIDEILAKSKELDGTDFADLYASLKENDYGLVLLLDEFDTVVKTDAIAPGAIRSFLSTLRSSSQEHAGIALVTCTREKLSQVCSDIVFLGSPFSNDFKSIPLPLFSSDEINGLLNSAFASLDLEPDQLDHNLLYNLAGGNPVFLVRAGELIFEQRRHGPLTEKSIETVIRNFDGMVNHYFSLYWDKSSLREQSLFIGLILSYLGKQSFPSLSEKDVEFFDHLLQSYDFNLRPLAERGLITAEGETYRLFSLAFATWIVRKVAAEGDIQLADRIQVLESDRLKQTWQAFKKLTRPPYLKEALQTLENGFLQE